MRGVVRFSIAAIFMGLAASAHADAHGGGGGLGGFGRGFHSAVRRPGFVQPVAPFVARSFQNRQFTRNGDIGVAFPNTVPTQFRNGFPWWRNGWGNWSGPVGGWGWPGDWGSGGYYGYANPPVQQVQAPAPEPQIIVIRSDGQGRVTTAEAPADYSYVKGCHAIPNGYHCDEPTAAP